MPLEALSPDEVVLWQWGFAKLNATILWTWALMALMALGSWLITRRLSSGTKISRWQNALEVIVDTMRSQIHEISGERPRTYLPFIGTLFLFIAVANALTILPVYESPMASLSTTAALAACVLVAVPVFGIVNEGLGAFLRHYITPSPLMLPFHVIGELSRTLALAVRLFGNVMSGSKIVAILVAIVPLLLPIVMRALGLLTGLIQAYIFAALAMVYIASGTEAYRHQRRSEESEAPAENDAPEPPPDAPSVPDAEAPIDNAKETSHG